MAISLRKLYTRHVRWMTSLQDVFLLTIRLYWGYRFFKAGYGKLQDIPNVVEFFTSLGIPLPEINAYLASITECVGGLCLMIGLGGRVVTIPLVFTMIVAYLTADYEAVTLLFSEPDKFLKAEPFLFMFTSLIVLLFGAGRLSLDHLLLKPLLKSSK